MTRDVGHDGLPQIPQSLMPNYYHRGISWWLALGIPCGARHAQCEKRDQWSTSKRLCNVTGLQPCSGMLTFHFKRCR